MKINQPQMIALNKTFTEFLEEVHLETYEGAGDDLSIELDFEIWLEDRDPQEIVELGDLFIKERMADFVALTKELKFQKQLGGECVGCVREAFNKFNS